MRMKFGAAGQAKLHMLGFNLKKHLQLTLSMTRWLSLSQFYPDYKVHRGKSPPWTRCWTTAQTSTASGDTAGISTVWFPEVSLLHCTHCQHDVMLHILLRLLKIVSKTNNPQLKKILHHYPEENVVYASKELVKSEPAQLSAFPGCLGISWNLTGWDHTWLDDTWQSPWQPGDSEPTQTVGSRRCCGRTLCWLTSRCLSETHDSDTRRDHRVSRCCKDLCSTLKVYNCS